MAERRLSVEEANARLMDLVRLTSDIVWETDRNLHILYVSGTVLRVTGYLAHELTGQILTDLWEPEDGQSLSATKPFRDIRCVAKTRDGEERQFLLSGLPVYGKEGEFLCTRGLAKDISLRVRAEKALQDHQNRLEETIRDRTRDLEYADRSKSEFLANMSHELRTPLNAIIGFSEALRKGIAGSLSDKQAEYISDIEMSGNMLLSLINDVLDLAKIEAGKTELYEDTFVLSELVTNTARLLTNLAMDKEVELVVEIGDEINLTADTRMCKQMLANLVSNAIKFTPAGGQVKIATTLNHNGELALTVVDTGIGMTSGGVDRAFEKFGQVAGGFNRLHTGTGLGLPLVAEQIALHGGTVAASSTVGKGTTMTLVFPASRVSLGRQGSLF